MKSICKVRPRLEGFLGRFFLVQLVFWLQALSGPGVHGGTGHHEASWRPRRPRRHRTSRGFMASTAAQDITRPHEASRRHRTSRGLTRPHGIPRGSSAARRPLCVTGASLSGRALWPGDLRASAASARTLRVLAIAPHAPVRSAPLEFTGDRRGPTLSGKAEPSTASALVNLQTMRLRLPRLALSPTS